MKDTAKKSIAVPMLIVGSMNAIYGFSLGVNAFFIPFVKQAFDVTTGMAYMIMVATFSAYLVFGGVTGPILKKAGYKGGMVIALILMSIGFLIIVPSAKMVSFPLFLCALFVNGLGQALLSGAYSTYLSIIGNPDSAAARISIMGICAKVFYAVASFTLAFFMDLANVRINDIITPFYLIAGITFIMGIVYYYSPLPEVKVVGEEAVNTEEEPELSHLRHCEARSNPVSHNQRDTYFRDSELAKRSTKEPDCFVPRNDEKTPRNDEKTPCNDETAKTSIWQFPHLLLGVVAIFFTVGVEYLALGTINDYATVLGLSNPQNYVWLVSFTMILGYVAGVLFIPKYVSQTNALVASTVLGITVTFIILFIPGSVSIWLIPVLGLANALLWPAVWPLAIADLGKFTKTGSSLLVTGIIGAGIVSLIFGFLAGQIGYQSAYAVALPGYLFILYFALWGNKIRT